MFLNELKLKSQGLLFANPALDNVPKSQWQPLGLRRPSYPGHTDSWVHCSLVWEFMSHR